MSRPGQRAVALLGICASMVALVACGGFTAAPVDGGSPSAEVTDDGTYRRLTPGADTRDPTALPESMDPKPPAPSVDTRQSASSAEIGETVPFDHLTVTVLKADRTADHYDLLVKTCVRKPDEESGTTARLGWEPWSLATSEGVRNPVGQPSASDRRAELYPTETRAAVGECVQGWLAIAVPESAEVADIVYQNGFGEVGSWRPEI